MPRDTLKEDAGACQRIDVVEAGTGWAISQNGRLTGGFEDIESAYKKALAICDSLFDKGVRARVGQTHAFSA